MTYMYLIFFSVFFGKILIALRHTFLRDDGHQSRFAEHQTGEDLSLWQGVPNAGNFNSFGEVTGKHSSNFLLFSILLSTQCLVTLAGTPCLSIFFFCRSSFMGEKKKEKEFSRPIVCFSPLHLFSPVICLLNLRWKPCVCKDKQEITTAWQKNPSLVFSNNSLPASETDYKRHVDWLF